MDMQLIPDGARTSMESLAPTFIQSGQTVHLDRPNQYRVDNPDLDMKGNNVAILSVKSNLFELFHYLMQLYLMVQTVKTKVLVFFMLGEQ